MIVALLAGGHVLFEDIPGVGKTLLVKALAKAVQGTFSRVQCTPDLLPSDILGFSVYNSQSKEFEFRPGPILPRSCWQMRSIVRLLVLSQHF